MKKIKLFDMNRPGKGISKQDAKLYDEDGVLGFFRMYKDRFWNLSTLNLFFVLCNFPLFFALAGLSGNFNIETTAPSSPIFAQIFGISQIRTNPFIAALLSVFSKEGVVSVPTTVTKVLFGLTLLLALTNGLSNVGFFYIARSYIRHEPVYIAADFFGAIKKNFKQGLFLGIIDFILLAVLSYGTVLYISFAGTTTANIMLAAEILLFLVYLTMRPYMYLILITFELSTFKILKNSFIFAVVGIKRNIVAWIGIAFVMLINLYLFFNLIFLGVALPFIITVATLKFMLAFAAYPIIKKYMIDPYYGDEKEPLPDEDKIFEDRG